MKKGDIVRAEVRRVSFPNRGEGRILSYGADAASAENVGWALGSDDPDTVRVKNALPGQVVEARITKMRHGKPEGQVLSVLKRAPGEYDPGDEAHVCPEAGACGGCLYQTYPYEKQVRLKEEMVRDIFTPVLMAYQDPKAAFDAIFQGVIKSPRETAYRNKMEFTFGDREKDGPLTLGLHKRGSFYDIIDASSCRICDGDFRTVVLLTSAYFREKGTSYYHKKTHQGFLRHLLVRKAEKTGEILIDLVTTGKGTDDPFSGRQSLEDLLSGWVDLLLKAPFQGKLTGVLHTVNDSLSDAVIDQGTEVLYGQDYFTEEILGLHFKITPFSFFQTNSSGAEELYRLARAYILGGSDLMDGAGSLYAPGIQSDVGEVDLKGKTVYDLYSGTGTIAQVLSPAAGRVIGIEIVPEAVEAAKENARANGIQNAIFLCGDVGETLDRVEDAPDLIVLDPPREGVRPKALRKILSYGVGEILYIACKPTSLARDIPAFREAGYRPVKMGAVDMFPSNPNLEVLCLFTNQFSSCS